MTPSSLVVLLVCVGYSVEAMGENSYLRPEVYDATQTYQPVGPSGGSSHQEVKDTHSGPGYKPPHTVDIYDVKEALAELASRVGADFAIHSDAATLLAAGTERINKIQDRDVPEIITTNQQQTLVLDRSRKQIDALKELGDDVKVQLFSALDTADAVDKSLDVQNGLIADIIVDDNAAQQMAIGALRTRVMQFRTQLLGDVDAKVDALDMELEEINGNINHLNVFVDSRICEIGTASIPPGEFYVPFVADFRTVPSVTLGLTGFGARFDIHSYDDYTYDALALDKHIMDISKDGFNVSAMDVSTGMVEVDTIYCVYMACQNLDTDYDPDNVAYLTDID